MTQLKIGDRHIGPTHPTYFIADIAANHDGDVERAKALIHLCAASGADAAKYQHFTAETIVSDYGFKSLRGQRSHQASWSKSVFDVYRDASIDPEWTSMLKETCDQAGIAFFTSPYSPALVDTVDPHVAAYKIGSGDVTWLEIIDYIARKSKPVLLATGASTLAEVQSAMRVVLARTTEIVLMQCNTNYTASRDNFRYINLNVLRTFRELYPDVVLGLSDHTPAHATVLGAVALGARVIEKHFTDDNARVGPDHRFSMTPASWREMVNRTRELESALGSGTKQVEANEQETVVLQRRAIRVSRDIPAGAELSRELLEVLRPCPPDGLPPYRLADVVGRRVNRPLSAGEHVRWQDLT